MDHAKVAGEVVEAVGGASNISAAAHCATRLRLVIADESKINQQALDDNEDLKGTFAAGGMFQIIVGPGDVDQVYDYMVANHGVREVSKDEAKEEAEAGGNIFSRFVKMIADIFVPVLPALIAGGLLMALHSVLTAKGLFGAESVIKMFPVMTDYDALINLVSSAAFASLPVLVGFSAAKRFGGNTYLGAAMGAAMVSPSLLSAYSMTDAAAAAKFWAYTDQSSVWNLFGLEVTKVGYQAMVIPTLVVTWIMCLIEKSLHKVLKGTADFLLTPLITLLITGFLAFVVVGPVTRELSNYLTYGINWAYTTLGVFGGLIFGFFYSAIVVTGLHQSFPAIEIPLLPSNGGVGDFIFPIASMANVAQGAAALAVFFKTRDAKLKGLAGAGGVSAVFGITEPAIFGVNLRLRWPFYCAMVAAAIGSGGVALLDVRGQALGAAGFVGFVSIVPKSIPAYLALEVLVFVLSFGFTFAYAMTRGKADMQGRAPAKKEAVVAAAVAAPAGGAAPAAAPAAVPSFSDEAKADLSITSPLAGTVVPLEQVKDESFAKGMLGPGIGIEPADGLVVAPFDGTVTVAFPTGHAYGLKSASGVQVLIHVGMDTVKLDGKGFTPRVAKGDVVRRGDVLAEVDLDVIRAAGYETITPVVVTNKKKFGAVTPLASGQIQRGDQLLEVAPKEA
ncbi:MULTISPECIES: sucrose-specific PTS transporter subunit IIBC [Actinomycetaceae]|uniref:sucrose-specific PTS transporter subunit IIBC n=1 Tax=Actinomycetaceae TaxID=2049 RepID=UPI00039650FE|nr:MULTISPECIES: sucrose-specific PTS transporter subunit IIBC [Actinomycetaceae]ERH32401.1 putative PTS system sucrose-specific IIBC component [Actinomyces sp. oral taxon 172 str. F0311]WLD78481.1 sucrose-specific PTS transporter subunit IIBC [Schaalia sp. HMT-172]